MLDPRYRTWLELEDLPRPAEPPPRLWTSERARALYQSEIADRARQLRGWRKSRLHWPTSTSLFSDL